MPEYYPVFLNIEDKPCVVIGGGAVAEQKVKLLLRSKAAIRVISPNFTPALQELGDKEKITLVQRRYRHGDLFGQFIATAATDDTTINEAVFQEANERGIPVNVVDVTRLCTFIVPAVVRRGDITFAISTGGKSPAMARKVREDVEKFFPEEYGKLLELVAEVREDFKKSGEKFDPETWNKALNSNVMDVIKSGKKRDARAAILSALRGTPEKKAAVKKR